MTTKITDANIDSNNLDNTNFNIGLLGFKMAVNEGLTVFNLVDGVVDEFNDESGTDEAEGTNDLYCGSNDYYINSNTPDASPISALSAGFTTTSITEPDTSTAGTNPTYGSGTLGEFTVPSGYTSLNAYVWGSGGSGGDHSGDGTSAESVGGGGGGFSTGTLSVSPGQTFDIRVGEGGAGGEATTNQTRNLGGGGVIYACAPGPQSGAGGGFSGILAGGVSITNGPGTPTAVIPQIYMIAGSGGGSGGHVPGGAESGAFQQYVSWQGSYMFGGSGGGLTGKAGGINFGQTDATVNGSTPSSPVGPIPATTGHYNGGGGDQEQGGQGSPGTVASGSPGSFLAGGDTNPSDSNVGAGGSGFYGGGAGGYSPQPDSGNRGGGGGSSYIGNPNVSCGTTASGGATGCGGGTNNPNYVAGTNEGRAATPVSLAGEDGYVLLTAAAVCATATSTTIVSSSFTSTTVPTTSRIVVFEENVDSPTLNTDIIASVSRDGTNFTNVTLADSGYVTGSSGQRILTGQVDISGQPSGQSMRWKLALANNTVKIHGVSLQWS